eukprot:1487513-Prymnesium_polylepis.1
MRGRGHAIAHIAWPWPCDVVGPGAGLNGMGECRRAEALGSGLVNGDWPLPFCLGCMVGTEILGRMDGHRSVCTRCRSPWGRGGP